LKQFSKVKSVPTKRAPDKWDSAAFSSIFLASSFFCSQAESQPAHLRVTQTVGWQVIKPSASLLRKFRLRIKSSSAAVLFSAAALFKLGFGSVFFASRFQVLGSFGWRQFLLWLCFGFTLSCRSNPLRDFWLALSFTVVLIGCVSFVGFGFGWLARFSKSACLFFAKVLAKIQVTLFQQASWFA